MYSVVNFKTNGGFEKHQGKKVKPNKTLALLSHSTF